MSVLHNIALSLVKGIGARNAKKLLLHFGDAEAVFRAGMARLSNIKGIGEARANAILHGDALERAVAQLPFIDKHGIKVLCYHDEAYPKRLEHCVDAPLLLYYKGTANLNQARVVSIVGTRNATAYGKLLCKQLIAELVPYDVLVVSGLAHGIDATAHQESLAAAIPTVGVLGHGLDRIYPAVHKTLTQKMVHHGGLLTEFLPGTVPDRENFPKRNRIIAGMADVTVVVEASIKGGALITAALANSYHKDVYAFPGRTNDVYSEGCNFLIKTNRAGLISHAKDLMYYMGWDLEQPKKEKIQTTLSLALTPNESLVMALLQKDQMPVDGLSQHTGLPQSQLAICLLNLEMQGMIVSLPGKMYKLA